MTLRVLALALWVWALTQQLPAEHFGWLASVLAVSSICALLAPLGIPYLFFADRQSVITMGDRWCQALGTLLVVGPILAFAGALLLDPWMDAPISLPITIVFMVSEVLTAALIQSAGLWGHSNGRLGIAAGLPAALTAARAVAAGLCMVLSINNNLILETYLFIHMLVGALAAFAVLTWTTRSVALKWRPVLPNIATCTAAWRYAAMSGAALASSELDKPLLVRVMGLLQVGHYALAYRICSAMAMPATALAAAMLPRWVDAFAKGDSISLQRSFLRVLLAVAVVGLILTALLYYWLTIYPPGSLGLYPQAWPWIHGLACLGLVLGLRQVAATSLIAVGRPLTRALLDIASLGILVTVAWLVYPALGSKAVILACIFAEICAAGAMAMIFFSALSNMKSIGSLSDV